MKYVIEAKTIKFQKEVEAELLRKACPTRKLDIRFVIRSFSRKLKVAAYSQKQKLIRWIKTIKPARLFERIIKIGSLVYNFANGIILLSKLNKIIDKHDLMFTHLFVISNQLGGQIVELERESGYKVTPINLDSLPTLQDLKGNY